MLYPNNKIVFLINYPNVHGENVKVAGSKTHSMYVMSNVLFVLTFPQKVFGF